MYRRGKLEDLIVASGNVKRLKKHNHNHNLNLLTFQHTKRKRETTPHTYFFRHS